MSSGLDLEIEYSVDDYVRGLTFIQNRQFIIRYGFIVVPLLVMAIILVQFVLNPNGFRNVSLYYALMSLGPVLATFLIFLLLKYFPNPFIKRNVKKQFRTSPLLQEKQRISIDEIRIQGETNLSAAETKWPAIIEATESNDDFFFFTSNKHAMFIPKRNLSTEQKDRLKEIAKSKLADKAHFE